MPRDIVANPKMDMERSLGWFAVAWLEALALHGNGDVIGRSVFPIIDEYVEFIVMVYALEEDGTRCHDTCHISRGKGAAKSELAALVGLFDALGPSRFDHWAEEGETFTCPYGTGFTYTYQEGEPVGRRMNTPVVSCIATEAGQAGEIYSTIHYNCTEGPLAKAFPSVDDVGLTRINIPGGGTIKPLTASGDSKDGGKNTLVLFDEVHLYKSPELHSAYNTLVRNLVKRRESAGTFHLETTTAHAPGEGSVGEMTHQLMKDIKSGKYKGRVRTLFDHRYADITPEELSDVDKLRAALTESYGDTLAWNSLEGMVDTILDPRTDISASFRYFFNSTNNAVETQWIASWEWSACCTFDEDHPEPDPVKPGDVITLGFDGSRKRRKGVTDATALVACRVRDGLIFPIAIWEQPPDYHGEDGWEVPVANVDAKVRETFKRYNVIGFYADPALWTPTIADWAARYGHKLQVRASGKNPIELWMTGSGVAKRTVDMLQKFQDAVLDRELTHLDDPTLTQHVLNARRMESTAGTQIRKEHPQSPRKIDAAVAAVLAWQARLDAVAKGLGATPKKRVAIKVR